MEEMHLHYNAAMHVGVVWWESQKSAPHPHPKKGEKYQ